MSHIYLLELIVDDLNIFSNTTQNDAKEPTDRCELCVRVQFGAELARCEVCEKDFGSTLGLGARKTGENCLFAYNPAWEMVGDEPMMRISAHEKSADGTKKLIGSWAEPGRKFLVDLARAYEDLNTVQQRSAEPSRESLRSCAPSEQRQQKNKPVSQTWKTMHPLQASGEAGSVETVGFVVVTIRMTCLGPNVNQKVLFGAREDRLEQPVTCYKMEDEPVVKCFTTDQLDTEQLVVPHGSLASLKEGAQDAQPEQTYDEYAAELNGNAICIRVEKDASIAVNIDGEREDAGCSTKGCWTSLTLPDGVYGLKEEFFQRHANACKLPVVRGTLKYPAYHWAGDFMLAKKTTPVTIEDFRKRPDPTRTVGLQTARGAEEQLERELAGIEIYRKGSHDPNVDVFEFKLGKPNPAQPGSGKNPRHWMAIELRTPKGPSWEVRPKETRAVQVLEEEFDVLPSLQSRPTVPQATPGGDGEAKGKKAAGKKGKKK